MLTRTDHPFSYGEPPANEPGGIDLKTIFAVIRDLWVYAAVGSLLFAALTAVYLLLATPLFTADASILLDTQSNQFLKKQNIMADPVVDTGVVDSQVEVLNSESIALAVIHKLNLADDPEFVGAPKGILGRMVGETMRLAAMLGHSVGLTTNNASKDDTPERKAVGVFTKRLRVKRVGISYVIDISFTSEDARKSAKIANAVAQAYIEEEIEASFTSTSRASGWLQGRLHDIRELAANADNAVQTYKQQNGIVDTGKGLMNQQQISDLNSQLIVAKAATAEAKARLDRIGHVNSKSVLDATVTDALSNAVITRLRAQYLDLQARRADLLARLGARHDTVIKTADQMVDIRNAISNEVQRIAAAYASDYAIAQAREASLEESLAALVGRAGTSDLAQVKLRDLESSAESYRQLYGDFLQKAQEATQQQTSPMTATRVITAATVPLHKSSPKSMIILAGALLLGAAAGGCTGYVRGSISETFLTAEDVAKVTNMPCLGVLTEVTNTGPLRLDDDADPKDRPKPNPGSIAEYVLDHPFSRYAETLRNTKIAIGNDDSSVASKVVAITSALPREGKTTVTMNLASLVASYGLRTLVIDCDLHSRGLTKLCAPEAKEGLIEALFNPSRFASLVIERPRSSLHILPSVLKGRLTNAAELLSSVKMRDLLVTARKDYDFIFVDLPPIAPVVDGKAMSGLVDDVVFVVGWNKSTKRLVTEALSSADVIQQRMIGTILNRIDPTTLRRQERYRTKEFGAYYVA